MRAGLFEYLKDPTISPILTSTLIAFGTVSFNLVAGLVTEKKRADLQLEVLCYRWMQHKECSESKREQCMLGRDTAQLCQGAARAAVLDRTV